MDGLDGTLTQLLNAALIANTKHQDALQKIATLEARIKELEGAPPKGIVLQPEPGQAPVDPGTVKGD